ncbi:MAG: protein kinase, partial [Desulfobulbaceae bacterium]|nr:protein kinase [Desulfobulbaceae bacterium]
IELNGKEYKITSIISGEQQSLEAVIYKITHASGKDYALKLYYKFTNPKDEPNPEALARIKAINDPDILKLHDFGTDHSKYWNKFCFEVCDFAEGSNLISVHEIRKKYTIEFLESNVVPEIFKGIRTLHDYKIYHCDLKPENIYYLDKEQTDLIIGDYGSAKTFEETSEKQLTHTSTTKGTSFYLAPEQPRGIVSEKNDYYSFGMILVHLLYPELVNRDSLHKIIERQFAKKPIIDFNPEYRRINDLIAGLTLYDISSRWGENEVKTWLRGEDVEVKYTSQVDVQVQPIRLGKATIKSVENLFGYIESSSDWHENLIEDNEGYGLLLRWVSDIQDLDRKKVFDKMVRNYQQDG